VNVAETTLPGVLVIEPKRFGDHRGFFTETFSESRYEEAGVRGPFVQDNLSRSAQGILRGLHFQNPFQQGKLVYCVEGEIFDVAVDVRVGSPRFGRWMGVVLDDETLRQTFVPAGFAHGFCVLSDVADVEYLCSDFYDPGGEAGLRWDDPSVGIAWPVSAPVLSERDRQHRGLDTSRIDLPAYTVARVR